MGVAAITLAYAVESQVGKRPTSGYIIMPDVIEMPISNEYLLDEALRFVAFYTDDQVELWQELIKSYDNAINQGLSVWFCVAHPQLDLANFFQGKPLFVKPAYTLGNFLCLGIDLQIIPLSAVQQAENPLKIGSSDYKENIARWKMKKKAGFTKINNPIGRRYYETIL